MKHRLVLVWARCLVAAFWLANAMGEPTPATRPVDDLYSAPPLPPGNPMEWAEHPLPLLHQRMTGDVYRKAYDAALQKSPDRTPAQAKGRPLVGMLVTGVDGGSEADKIGVKTGDILVKLDDDALTSEADLLTDRTRKDQTLAFMNASGKIKSGTIKRGAIGVHGSRYWGMYDAYLLSPGRAEKYDKDFRVAGISYNDNPQLAETALRDAFDAGYRGYPLLAAMAYICYASHQFEDCLAFLVPAMKQATADERRQMAVRAENAASPAFKFKLASDLFKEYPGGNDVETAKIDTTLKLLGPFLAINYPNPIEQCRTLESKDATGEIVHWLYNGKPDEWAVNSAKDLAARRPMKFSSASGNFTQMSIGPCADNIDVKFKFQFKPTDDKNTEWAKTFCIGIGDVIALGKPAMRFNFYDSGRLEIIRADAPDCDFNCSPPFGLNQPAYFHLAIVGYRMELVVNGQRILYGPISNVPNGKLLGAVVNTVGITGEISNLSWRIPQLPAAPPANVPAKPDN